MEKNLDSKGRWRNKIVAFRVSPEEAEQIDACVRLSGLSKQDYITKRLTDLHIDFVPFTTGSKRGLDTRVSLKQALAAQGFKGGSRGDTEWSQWVQAEKEQLAAVMERYGIEWEHKDTHEKHLSVLDYKKQEREKEVEKLGAKIEQKQAEFEVLSERVLNYDND